MASETARPPAVAVPSPGASRPPLLDLSPNTNGHPLTAGSSPGLVSALKASPLGSGICDAPASCASPLLNPTASAHGSAATRNTPVQSKLGPASHAIASMCFDEEMLNSNGLLNSVSCLTSNRNGGVHDSIAQLSWQDRMGRNSGTNDSSMEKSGASSVGSSLNSSVLNDAEFSKEFSGEGLQDESISLDTFKKVPSPTDSAEGSPSARQDTIDFDSIAAEAATVSNGIALDSSDPPAGIHPEAADSMQEVDFDSIAAEAADISNEIACAKPPSLAASDSVQTKRQDEQRTASNDMLASIQFDFDSMGAGEPSLSLDFGQDSVGAEKQLQALESVVTTMKQHETADADDDAELDEAVEMAELLAAQFERAVNTKTGEATEDLPPPGLPEPHISESSEGAAEATAAREQAAQNIIATALEQAMSSADNHPALLGTPEKSKSLRLDNENDDAQAVAAAAVSPPASVDAFEQTRASHADNPAEQTAIDNRSLPLSDDELAEEFVAALDLAASLAGCEVPPPQLHVAAEDCDTKTSPEEDAPAVGPVSEAKCEAATPEKDQWLHGHTNDVYGSEIRASVQVTSISSAYEAKTGTPVLAPLGEDEAESALAGNDSPAENELPALTPSAEGPETSRGKSLTPEADNIMETFLQKFSINTPIQKLANELGELEVPGTEVLRPEVRDSNVFYSPRAAAETPKSVTATIAARASVARSPDGDDAFYSPEERSPVARCGLQDEEDCPPTELLDALPGVEKTPEPHAAVPEGNQQPEKTEGAPAIAVEPATVPLPPCSLTPLALIPEDETAEIPTGAPPIPSFWGGFGRSGMDMDMDASMVLHGSINLGVRESAYGPSTSGFKDALDLEDKAAAAGDKANPGTAASPPPLRTPEFQSIFADAAAVAQSLEEDGNLQIKANLFGSSADETSGQAAKPAASSNDFTLGKASPGNLPRGGSRLRAPRSSYNFFDKAHVSKSVDELFKVSTPAKFRSGSTSTSTEQQSSELPPAAKGSAAKSRQNKTLFPGGMSCPGPIFGFGLDEVEGRSPPSPSSWLFPVHPLAKAAGDQPLKLYPKTGTSKPAYARSNASSLSNSADNVAVAKCVSSDDGGNTLVQAAHQRGVSAAHDAPLKSHPTDAGRVTRRVRRSGGTSTSQSSLSNSATSITGSSTSAPRAGMPPNPTQSEPPVAPKPAAPARIRTSGQPGRSSGPSAAFAAVASASQNGGILYVDNRASSAVANRKPTGGTAKMSRMFAKGVSRLRKPSGLGKKPMSLPPMAPVPPGAPAAEAPGPAAAPEEGQVKRLFSWKAVQSAATPAGPGKRRRKCHEEADLVPETPKASSYGGFGGAIMKMATPLSGLKKTASKFLSSPAMKRQPNFE